MVLRGIYDDPSYNELSFGQILVMLARKGIEVETLKEGLKITPRILEECSPLNMVRVFLPRANQLHSFLYLYRSLKVIYTQFASEYYRSPI